MLDLESHPDPWLLPCVRDPPLVTAESYYQPDADSFRKPIAESFFLVRPRSGGLEARVGIGIGVGFWAPTLPVRQCARRKH